MKHFSRKRKFVNHKKRILFFSLFFLLLFISVGYAYLSASLSINGNTTIASNIWDIHFENLTVNSASVPATTPAAINGNSTSISYSVKLSNPGDIYEFSVDVVNAGTIPAKVSLVTMQGITSEVESYLDYSIKYTYGDDVQVDDLLNPNSRKRIIVRLMYKNDYTNLPDETIPLDITYTINYIQTTEFENNVGSLLQNLYASGDECVTKYDGQVTDRVGETVTAANVYYDICSNKRNVIYGGYCWQIVRTTETGGLKVIYNGEPVNNTCESNRADHKGFIGTTGAVIDMAGTYVYGSDFYYDTTNEMFALNNIETASFSESTYTNLIGKYTCKSNGTTCSTLYSINGFSINTYAYATTFTIGNVNYSSIGTVPFNANYLSPSSVGYMFNNPYNRISASSSNDNYKFGSTFTYDNNSGNYTLGGTIYTITDWSTDYNQLNNTHYTCLNSTGICDTIAFVYATDNENAYLIAMQDGNDIDDILVDMLSTNNINHYDSTIKGIIDNWYRQNLNIKAGIDDAVYCNSRNIVDYGGFSTNGSTVNDAALKFKNYPLSYTLDCPNITDQFSVSNNKAKLTYPVALLTHEELAFYRNSTAANNFRKIGNFYWDLSPHMFLISSNIRGIETSGAIGGYHFTGYSADTRPAITLKNSISIQSGTGSETDPWIVED